MACRAQAPGQPLVDAEAADRSADDELLDLLGASEDVHDPGPATTGHRTLPFCGVVHRSRHRTELSHGLN
jgi:hypothetical protein